MGMETHSEKTVPAKCERCNKPMTTPLVCDFCHSLSPTAAVADYFTLLEVEQRYDLNEHELRRRYVALSRHAHPDFHAADGSEMRDLHLRVAAALNDAYRTLSDPAERAAYLLEMLGGKSSAEDKSVPEGFLGTMMMMQEELTDAKAASDKGEIKRLEEVLSTQRDGLLKRIAGLFEEHQQAVACQAVRTDLLDEIRKQLNAVSYVRKLLSQL